MRKEFLQINAQLRDMKKIEKELITVEIKQVTFYDLLITYEFMTYIKFNLILY